MNWLMNRLGEASTWRGLIVLAGIVGYKMDPALQDAIVQAAVAAMALVEVLRKENSKRTVPGGPYNPNADVRPVSRV